jgi:orotate phosphoribosyltransferase
VATDLLSLIPRLSGHFRMASGLHSDAWLDLDVLLACPPALRPHLANLAEQLFEFQPDIICGPLVGGAFIAELLADQLKARFCYAEQPAGCTEFVIAAVQRASLPGRRIAIVDDAIHAGSAVRGALSDAIQCGATPVALAALIVLGSSASELARKHGVPLISLVQLDAGLWNPVQCPLCAAGVPIANA